MIITCLKLRSPAEMHQDFIATLQEHSALAEGTAGCLETGLYQAAEDEDVLLYMELWSSDEDLRKHLQADCYRKLLLLIDMSIDPPELNFYEIVRHSGMDVVRAARQPT